MKQFRQHLFSWRRIWLLVVCLAASTLVPAQNKAVSGRVTDSGGQPLVGASVQVKGTRSGTSTDVNGKFILPVSSDKVTLTISMTGYATQTVNASVEAAVIVVLREDMKGLDEVVVVAYGKQKKADVIGSVSQISGKELEKAPTMNVTNMLAGRISGVTTLQQSGRPGADDATIRIRGVGTYGKASPLIIIDNVQRPSFSYLDPSEIESITVLKDAVSTAVYGLQAANGIILITTKHGKNHKPVITYNGAVTVNSNTRFPKFLNGPDYMEWYNKGTDMDNDYNAHTGADPVPYVYTQDQIDALRNGTNTNPLLGNTDWIGELTGRHSMSQQHSVSVSGGTDKVKYFTSVGLLDQDGVVKNTGFKRYNIRTNIDADLNDYFSVNVGLGARQQQTHTPGISPDNTAYMNPFYQAVRMLPNLPMYDENGVPTAYYSNAGWVNPLAAVDMSGYQRGETNLFQGNISFNLKVPGVRGLEMKLLTAYDKSSTENKGWLTPYTMMGRNRDQTTGNLVAIHTEPGISRTTLRQSYSQYNRKTFQPSITYNKEFGDHKVSALALYEWSQQSSNVFSTGASNFALTDLQEIDFGSPATEDQISPTGSSRVDDSRAGYVLRLNYGFNEKYLFEIATRYDASIKFTKNNRWEAFPAAAVGWIISKENFFEKLGNTISYLKLKGSVGRLGNDGAISNFGYLQTFSLTSGPVMVIGGQPVLALYTNGLPNVDLRWETSTLTNVGFESEFWNGKLGVDFEWFYKLTKDILDNPGSLYPLSLGGYAPSALNYGVVANRGFDLQIRHRNRIGKFQYGITGNLNWARNKILRLNENTGLPSWQRKVGRSIGSKYGFIVDGMYQNWEEALNGTSPSGGYLAPGFFKYKDINGDGRLTRADDMTYIGRSNLPELMYGLNIDLHYGNFDMSVLFQGAAMADVSLAGTYEGASGVSGVDDNTPFTKTFYGYGNSPYFLVQNSWTPDNPNAAFPRLTAYKSTLSSNNAHINSGWIRDGSYLRLKSAQIGYSIPAKVLNNIKVQQVRVYVSGFNLFTWDKLKYLDPEMPNVNNGFYPQQRMLSAGLNVTF